MKTALTPRRTFALAVASALVAVAQPAWAQTSYQWASPASGNWQDATKWTPNTGAPIAGDTAIVVGSGTYTLTLQADASIDQLSLGASTDAASGMVLDLNGHTLSATSMGSTNTTASLRARASSTTDTSVTFRNGTIEGQLFTFSSHASSFKTTITLDNVTLNLGGIGGTTHSSVNQIGGDTAVMRSVGELLVTNGSKVKLTQSSLRINGRGDVPGASLVRVTGVGSKVDASTATTAFNNTRIMTLVATSIPDSKARLEVLAGGTFVADDISITPGTTNKEGVVQIAGSGSELDAKRIYVAGGISSGGGSPVASTGGKGFFRVENGGLAEVSQGFVAFGLGEVVLDNGRLLVNGSGADATFSAGSKLSLTLNSSAQAAALEVNDVLTLESGAILNLALGSGFSAAVNDEITLAAFASRTGTFSGLGEAATITVQDYTFSIHYTTDRIFLTAVAVPEPGSVALLGGMAGVALILRAHKKGQRAVK